MFCLPRISFCSFSLMTRTWKAGSKMRYVGILPVLQQMACFLYDDSFLQSPSGFGTMTAALWKPLCYHQSWGSVYYSTHVHTMSPCTLTLYAKSCTLTLTLYAKTCTLTLTLYAKTLTLHTRCYATLYPVLWSHTRRRTWGSMGHASFCLLGSLVWVSRSLAWLESLMIRAGRSLWEPYYGGSNQWMAPLPWLSLIVFITGNPLEDLWKYRFLVHCLSCIFTV